MFRKYVIIMVVFICLTFAVSCVFIADESARKVCLGDSGAMLAFGSTSESIGNNITDISPYIGRLTEIMKRAAVIAPPPVSSFYYLFS